MTTNYKRTIIAVTLINSMQAQWIKYEWMNTHLMHNHKNWEKNKQTYDWLS